MLEQSSKVANGGCADEAFNSNGNFLLISFSSDQALRQCGKTGKKWLSGQEVMMLYTVLSNGWGYFRRFWTSK
jgi:hypothetical protein